MDAGLGAGPLGKAQIALFKVERERQLLVGCVAQSTQQQSVDISIKKSRLGGGHGILLPIKGKVQDRLYKQLVVTVNKSVISHAGYITDPADDRLISEVILDRLDIRRTACADNGGDGYGWSVPTVKPLLNDKRSTVAIIKFVCFSIMMVVLKPTVSIGCIIGSGNHRLTGHIDHAEADAPIAVPEAVSRHGLGLAAAGLHVALTDRPGCAGQTGNEKQHSQQGR